MVQEPIQGRSVHFCHVIHDVTWRLALRRSSQGRQTSVRIGRLLLLAISLHQGMAAFLLSSVETSYRFLQRRSLGLVEDRETP